MRLATFAVSCLVASTSWAQNPVWLEGMTDEVYSITVYHSETCGCCKAWIDHLEQHAFDVTSYPSEDMGAVKQRYGVPAQAASCHTAIVDELVVEGHVPATDIKRVLNRSDVPQLLTVPGMPSGSPGMDFAGARMDPFAVYAVTGDQVSVVEQYSGE